MVPIFSCRVGVELFFGSAFIADYPLELRASLKISVIALSVGDALHRAALNEGEPLAADDATISVTHRIRRNQEVINPAPNCLSSVCGDDADYVVGPLSVLRQVFRLTKLHGDKLHSVKIADYFCRLLRAGNALALKRLHDSSVLVADVDGVRCKVDNVRHSELLSGALPQCTIMGMIPVPPAPNSNFRKVGVAEDNILSRSLSCIIFTHPTLR